MNGSLLTVISPDISITSYDMQSACVCARVCTVRRPFLSPASGCWWSQIASPLAINWSHRSEPGDRPGKPGLLEYLRSCQTGTKCPFLRIAKVPFSSAFVANSQRLSHPFPFCLTLPFSNPMYAQEAGRAAVPCCPLPSVLA